MPDDLDLISAAEIQPKKVRWLFRNRIPRGMITVVAGKPDQGKGLFAAHLAADVSRRGGNVIYSAIEDAADMMTRPRLEAAGANLNRVLLKRFLFPNQLDELAVHVVETDARLVVIDPFSAHLGGVSKFSDKIRQVTTPLSTLAEETGAAIVITEHALKRVAKDAHPLGAIAGHSSGLPAASRMAFVFGSDPKDSDRRILACVKSNLSERPKALAFETDLDELSWDYEGDLVTAEIPSLIYKGETEFDARRILTESGSDGGKTGPAPTKRANAAEWLITYLATAGKPVPAGEVIEDAKHHGHSAKTIRRAADEADIVRDPPGGGRTCTWELPEEIKKWLAASKTQKGQMPPSHMKGDDDG